MSNYLHGKTRQYHCQLLNKARLVYISESANSSYNGYSYIQVGVKVCPAPSYIHHDPTTGAQVRIAG